MHFEINTRRHSIFAKSVFERQPQLPEQSQNRDQQNEDDGDDHEPCRDFQLFLGEVKLADRADTEDYQDGKLGGYIENLVGFEFVEVRLKEVGNDCDGESYVYCDLNWWIVWQEVNPNYEYYSSEEEKRIVGHADQSSVVIKLVKQTANLLDFSIFEFLSISVYHPTEKSNGK